MMYVSVMDGVRYFEKSFRLLDSVVFVMKLEWKLLYKVY